MLGSMPRAQLPTPETGVPVTPADPALSSPDVRSPLSVIVIDPGHGGDDVGVRGDDGVEEKAITLAVAQRVKALIEMRLGIRVVLTRSDDRRVNLDERAAIANNSRAGLFVSLHLNSSPAASTGGAQVVRLREGRSSPGRGRRMDDEESVALPVSGGGARTVDLIRWDFAQARHVDASAALAATLEEQLRTRVPMSARPGREMPLRVVTSVDMPAVLFEMAYLSHTDQEALVRTDSYQEKIAQAIHDTVLQFRSYLEGRIQ